MLQVKGYWLWVQRVVAQRVQKETLYSIKGAKGFDTIRHITQRQDNETNKKQKMVESVSTVEQDILRDSALPTARLLGNIYACAETASGPGTTKDGRSIHYIRQDDKTHPVEQDQKDKSFDSVKIKYLSFEGVKSVIFTKLE